MVSYGSKENLYEWAITWQLGSRKDWGLILARVLVQDPSGSFDLSCYWSNYRITSGFRGASSKERISHASYQRLYFFSLGITYSHEAIFRIYPEGNLCRPHHSRFRSSNLTKAYPRNLWGSWLKALEAALPSPIIISPKIFSLAPNLQTQEGVVIRMLKPFLYQDSHHVSWKYDVTLTSTWTGKEEGCSNVSLGLVALNRIGRCYSPVELEKRRKEIRKSTAEPVMNSVTTEEAEKYLKTIRKSDYSVIQQLNTSPT